MSDEVHVDADELRKLGTTFELHAYDLGRHLSAFKRRTDAEALLDVLESPEGPDAELRELSEVAGQVIGRLQERLDEIGNGLKAGALNTEVAEQEINELMRGVQ
ncbi:hypothetical protein ABZW18_20285 [Streptomyces sp. NPDC004647]|jgi:hypothetical protein|uniref:hypothetical protein n=1 Tax=Streptomyces sp. NPDC004647 TaxID=3154671 RepID=UPI0033B0EFF5